MTGTEAVAVILKLAAHEAVTAGYTEITTAHLLIALSRLSEEETPSGDANLAGELQREFDQLGIAPRRFRRRLRAMLGKAGAPYEGTTIHRSQGCRDVFAHAEQLAREERLPLNGPHLLRAAFVALSGRSQAAQDNPSNQDDASPDVPPQEPRVLSLGELTAHLRALRATLLDRVYGQDHAIHQFVEGLFNVEVVGAADTARRKPAGLFVFAGPPGVGKTYLAELGASHLDREFKRFDMSAYAVSHEGVTLAGSPPIYRGAQPGVLTEFVKRNPNAVLLFDEIEKAHVSTIQLFLQILDAGRLQDKFTEEEINFRHTILIFTTNVGRRLYDHENEAGVHQANAAFHRNTLLDALRSEVDPRTREPFFPASICSRMATGHPILFNHLQVDQLARIAKTELARIGTLLETRHGQQFHIAEEIPLAIVMREGARTDARTITAQAEAFLKQEVFKACSLFTDERLDKVFSDIKEIAVEIDDTYAGEAAEKLFHQPGLPSVLLVTVASRGIEYSRLQGIDWVCASTFDQVFDTLVKRDVDFVLLDLAITEASLQAYQDVRDAFHDMSELVSADQTVLGFDYQPYAARRFAVGQRILEELHRRMPAVPTYLLSIEEGGSMAEGDAVDEELLMACVRAGGARGIIRSTDPLASMETEIKAVSTRLRMERMAEELAGQSEVLAFDTAPILNDEGTRLTVRCRNLRIVRAVRSTDMEAIVTDLERPTTRFGDVVGAQGAKEAMSFLREWLRDPKRHAAAGVDPPRGVLLTGSPGTGKTMLARALAGESDCVFLSESATSFDTKWVGSGPEAIRTLFRRARRYAPSIVFIDEIDAIGKTRTGTDSVGRSQEMTLNALLTEMDGFAAGMARPVIVIAATNLPDILDPALTRRFSRVIEVELPTRSEREAYIRVRLEAKAQHEVSGEMIERLAAQGQNLSIADLERIFAQAAVMALANKGVINDSILAEAFEKVTMGEAKAGTDPLRTARHEAGHAVVMCEMGAPPIYVTIVGRGSFGGYAAFEDQEKRGSQTKRELENMICQLLGGREAERLFYGDGGEGDSTGPSNDLERATNIAEAMVYELGMSEEIGFIRIDRRRPLSGNLADRCHGAVRGIMEAQSQHTRKLLSDRRQGLDRIAEALVERNRLLKHEVLELLQDSESLPGGDDQS